MEFDPSRTAIISGRHPTALLAHNGLATGSGLQPPRPSRGLLLGAGEPHTKIDTHQESKVRLWAKAPGLRL